MVLTLAELAEKVNGTVIGDEHCLISNVGTLEAAAKGDITFLSNPKLKKHLPSTKASAVILTAASKDDCTVTALVVDNPYAAYARITQLLFPLAPAVAGIHASSCIGSQCEIDQSVQISAHCVIGDRVTIAANTVIGPGCIIADDVKIGGDSRLVSAITLRENTRIGARTIIHSGVVIGTDGFGQADDKGVLVKIMQVGGVLIGDDVEIGANTTIDRGALNDTTIGHGVKLDNLIQIGHNVVIGDHTAIASSTAVAGSAVIGKYCRIGGAVGIVGHIEIADSVTITGMSFVHRSITESGTYSSGTPLETNRHWHRNFVRMAQLDDMSKRIKTLESALNAADKDLS